MKVQIRLGPRSLKARFTDCENVLYSISIIVFQVSATPTTASNPGHLVPKFTVLLVEPRNHLLPNSNQDKHRDHRLTDDVSESQGGPGGDLV